MQEAATWCWVWQSLPGCSRSSWLCCWFCWSHSAVSRSADVAWPSKNISAALTIHESSELPPVIHTEGDLWLISSVQEIWRKAAHIAVADFSRPVKLMWHRPGGSLAADCRRPAVAVINFFLAAWNAVVMIHVLFGWPNNPQNCPIPWGSGLV